MNKTVSLGLFATAAMLAGQSAFAADPADLAKAKGCLNCHSVEAKIVGPAYKDVAKKYAGQKDAENQLVQKVLKGTSGTWGPVPMPANAGVSDAEAHTLVKWVLSLK
jgi:cytochrome c